MIAIEFDIDYIHCNAHRHTHSERDATDSESNDRKYKLKNIYIFKRCLKINAIDFICFNFVQFIQLQQSCIHFTRNHESTFIHCANASQMNAHLLPNSVWNFAVPNRRFFFHKYKSKRMNFKW